MNAPARPAAFAPASTVAMGATLIDALMANSREMAGEIAFREREFGIWRARTWREVADDVLALAAGLEEIGLARGGAVTILGDNRYKLYAAMLAAGALGAFPAPVFADVPPDELELYSRHGRPDIAIAEDQEQVDKLLVLRERTGRPAHILYDDPRGIAAYGAGGLVPLDGVLARGRERLAADPALAADLAGRAGGDDIAVLMHTSGTTGAPKGIAIRHRNVMSAAASALASGFFRVGDEHYAYLPMAWVGDFLFFASGIVLRFRINIPERQETVMQDLRAVAPTMYLAAPRAWDNMLTRVQVGIGDSTPFKRWIFDVFMPRAVALERKSLAGGTPTWSERLVRAIGEAVVFAPIKDVLGLSRAERAYTGGEALGEDTFLFFRALGINLKQFYAQTETTALTAAQPDGGVKLHTVGVAMPGVELRLDEDGQILVRSGAVVDGYYDDPAATAASFVDGWLKTGDAGRIEDGQLIVLGRVGEVVRTAAGEIYIPNYIENRIKFSPYIRNVAVVGAGRAHLGAITCIDIEAVGHWAETRGLAYTSYADLSQRPEVRELVRGVLAHVNGVLPEGLAIRRFTNLHKDFDPDDGEITRTRKLRRNLIEERYAPIIAAIYDGRSEVGFEARVTYENGEVGFMKRDLAIAEVGT